jgi:hypothetical protein
MCRGLGIIMKTKIIATPLPLKKKIKLWLRNQRTHPAWINRAIRIHGFKSYLEIGIDRGYCFDYIKAEKKVGVDPQIRLSNPLKESVYLYEMTSNEFFQSNNDEFDIVFIDGLHQAGQTFDDIVNSIKVINPKGLIFVHDIIPPHAGAAMEASSFEDAKITAIKQGLPWTNEWTGDVWKSISALQREISLIDIRIIPSDYGVAVIRITNNLVDRVRQKPLQYKNPEEKFENFIQRQILVSPRKAIKK